MVKATKKAIFEIPRASLWIQGAGANVHFLCEPFCKGLLMVPLNLNFPKQLFRQNYLHIISNRKEQVMQGPEIFIRCGRRLRLG